MNIGKVISVRNISSRLKVIINILLNKGEPVPVKELAENLKVSRRTVFRELTNTESVLNSFGLNIGTKAGKGIYIDGEKQNIQVLNRTIKRMGDDKPADRSERRLRLLMTLIRDSELNKLVQYADRFDVSVSTISNDLNEIESWLKQYDIELSRGTGTTITVAGNEISFRRAELGILNNWRKSPYDIGDIFQSEIADFLCMIDKTVNYSRYMIPYSKDTFELYLNIMIQRVELGRTVNGIQNSEVLSGITEKLSDQIEKHFSIRINEEERRGISLVLLACSTNLGDYKLEGSEYARLLRLSHQLIDNYDSELAPLLKIDAMLQKNLLSHLRSAVLRWENKIEFDNSLSEQMSSGFADIIAKTRRAVAKFEKDGVYISENEICLLASHFAVAESRISDQLFRSKNVCIGVICIYGIGTSYLLASQIRKHFSPEVKFEVGCWDDFQKCQNFDFLISTTPIPNSSIPVVEVPFILNNKSIQLIRNEVTKASSRKKVISSGSEGDVSIVDYYRPIESLMAEVRLMLSKFQTIKTNNNISFEELASLASYTYGYTQSDCDLIFKSLIAREKISTQILEELELILMHCQTDGIKSPVLGLIVPEGGRFINPYFQGAKSCVVIIVPQNPSREEIDMIGAISSAIINDELFLNDIIEGNDKLVRMHLEEIIKRYLQQCVSTKLYDKI